MAEKELEQPQVEETPEAALPGAEKPQVIEPSVVTPPGAEPEPVQAERTYTQAEWSERESAKDKEVAELRKFMARQAMQQEVAQAQAAETQAQAADRLAVESGEITEAEARERPEKRYHAWQQGITQQRERANLARAKAETDEGLRILAAEHMAKEYGVEAKELLADQTLTDPIRMEAKAVKLALEKAKADLKAAKSVGETFDSGQLGRVVSEDTSKLSPRELARQGYVEGSKKRR